MIPRYTRPEMAAIWDPQTRYRIWFEIEALSADAMADLGIIPKAAANPLTARPMLPNPTMPSVNPSNSISGKSQYDQSALRAQRLSRTVCA